MKRLIKNENIYANTRIENKEFSAIDIIDLLCGISQLSAFDISTVETNEGDICFMIGNDIYNSHGEKIEISNGYNIKFAMV